MMIHILTATEAELLQADRTRRTDLLYRSANPARPLPMRVRLAAIARRAWALAF